MNSQPLRNEVYAELRRRVVFSQVAPGSKLHDFAVARELGVSRTPVREALLRLDREGLVVAEANRGFLVRPLSLREAEETYPIIVKLEMLALSSFDPRVLDAKKLDNINARIAGSRRAKARANLDLAFHETLLEPAQNGRLHDILRTLKQIVLRYEYVFMKDSALVRSSWAEHSDIVAAVKGRKQVQALEALQRHWESSMFSLLRLLRTHLVKGSLPERLIGSS